VFSNKNLFCTLIIYFRLLAWRRKERQDALLHLCRFCRNTMIGHRCIDSSQFTTQLQPQNNRTMITSTNGMNNISFHDKFTQFARNECIVQSPASSSLSSARLCIEPAEFDQICICNISKKDVSYVIDEPGCKTRNESTIPPSETNVSNQTAMCFAMHGSPWFTAF
jgi:hypothetical protein